MFFPILASVGFRQLPWTSVSTYIAKFGQHDMWEWARGPKFLSLFLALIPVFIAVLPDYSPRQLPPDSVSAHKIIVQFRQRDMCVFAVVVGGVWGGPRAKVPGSLFSLNSSLQRCFTLF